MESHKELTELIREVSRRRMPPMRSRLVSRDVTANVEKIPTLPVRYKHRFEMTIGCDITEYDVGRVAIANKAAATLHREIYGGQIAALLDLQATMYAEGLMDTEAWKQLGDILERLDLKH